MEAFCFGFGDEDAYVIADMPSNRPPPRSHSR